MVVGAAQMTPGESQVLKEVPGRRTSGRLRGVDAKIGSSDDLEGVKLSREMKNLLTKGGVGGEMRGDANFDWDFFPKKGKYLSEQTRCIHNKNVFTSLQDVLDNKHDFENEIRQEENCNYQIINVAAMQDLINKFCSCRNCKENEIDDFIDFCRNDNQFSRDNLKSIKEKWKKKREKKQNIQFNISNIGLEPFITIHCPQCDLKDSYKNETTKFKGTNYNGDSCKNENCSWYATNIRVVLATLATGMGAADVSSFLSFFGLPSLQSFVKKQFYRIENLLGPYLRETAHESVQQSLDLEVKKTIEYKEATINNYKHNSDDKVGLTVSYDMGWSKRSSGSRYDSISGHAFLVGRHSHKIVGVQVTSKKCKICSIAESKGLQPREHECPMNYKGSSKAMEADGALSLVTKLDKMTDSKVFLEAIVTDDDSSIRAVVAHATPKGKGRLPPHIQEPTWFVDPSHRTRVVARAVFHLARMKLADSRILGIDAKRFKRYFGYMLKQAQNLTLEEFINRSKACLEHLFNNHQYCDPKWCKPLQAAMKAMNDDLPDPPTPSYPEDTDEEQYDDDETTESSFYRSKDEDEDAYQQMKEALSHYITPERLNECLHSFHTQINEVLTTSSLATPQRIGHTGCPCR